MQSKVRDNKGQRRTKAKGQKTRRTRKQERYSEDSGLKTAAEGT
jgi:hypothetical protein